MSWPLSREGSIDERTATRNGPGPHWSRSAGINCRSDSASSQAANSAAVSASISRSESNGASSESNIRSTISDHSDRFQRVVPR